jgi:hypothetical protein
LKHFAGGRPKNQVWTYDKSTGTKRSAIPDETGIFTHFYSIELKNGSYDLTMDNILTDNENFAAPIYEKLIKGELPTSPQEREEFSVFISLLYLRTKAQRQDSANLAGRYLQTLRYACGTHDGAFNTLISRMEKDRGEKIPDAIKEEVRRRSRRKALAAFARCQPLATQSELEFGRLSAAENSEQNGQYPCSASRAPDRNTR